MKRHKNDLVFIGLHFYHAFKWKKLDGVRQWSKMKNNKRQHVAKQKTKENFDLLSRAWRKFCMLPISKAKRSRPRPTMAIVKSTSQTK
jgi:hypothetical protein